MKITYKITKRRGNWRPVVGYTCEKTQEEVDLGVPRVDVKTKIPRIEFSTKDFVGPGDKERAEGWAPTGFISIEGPTAGVNDPRL